MLAEQLKKSILQAAIQGKLTDQRKEDGNAQDLYNQIQEEKQKLIKEKKIKKEKSLSNITAEEIPFDIPKNWMWVRFGDVANYRKGPFGSSLTKAMFVPKSNNTVKVYEQKNAIRKDASLGNYYIPYDYYEKKMQGFVVHSGDIIVSCAGTIGEAYILPSDIELGILNQALMRVRTYQGIKKEYFLACFGYAITRGDHKGNGTAIKNIPPFSILKKMMFPLPPLAEQKRIVETIQKYLAEIEQLEKDEEALAELQKAFPGKMKASILQQAIQGKLTDQRKEDGNAQDLYNQIQEEKQRLIKEKKIKKEKPLPEIAADEIPFEIPENWMWVRLEDVGLLQTGITPSKAHSEFYGNEIPFVGPGDIFENYRLNYHKNGLSSEGLKHARVIAENSVMQVCIGGSIGKAVINDREVTCNQQINTITPYFIETKYIFYCMISRYFVSSLRMKAGGSATPIINKTKWAMMLVPLPPLAEQKRIVEKLNKLLPLCEA